MTNFVISGNSVLAVFSQPVANLGNDLPKDTCQQISSEFFFCNCIERWREAQSRKQLKMLIFQEIEILGVHIVLNI